MHNLRSFPPRDFAGRFAVTTSIMRRFSASSSVMTRAIMFALCVSVPLGSMAAQKLGPAPKRPKIDALDTNDARGYFDYGMRVIANDPGSAANAFYWAARIDPGMADALHGRRAALLLDDESLLRRFMTNKGNPSKKEQQLDSLQLRAIMLNPFLYRKLDLSLLRTYYRQMIERDSPGSAKPSALEIDFVIDQYLRQAGPDIRGWMSYARGDFKNALSQYGDALKRTKEQASLRIERGRMFAMQGNADSAIVEFQSALTELRKKDAKNVVVLYNSKAVVEQAIGILLETKNDLPGAREAYGRALQEDLAYWPAHVSLGMAAITAKDTATAISELTLATEIAPDEPYVQGFAGAALAMLGRPKEASGPLKKAIALEPYYALPHVAIGRLFDATNNKAEAIVAYEGFLARASKSDPQRTFAEGRLAALKSSGAQ